MRSSSPPCLCCFVLVTTCDAPIDRQDNVAAAVTVLSEQPDELGMTDPTLDEPEQTRSDKRLGTTVLVDYRLREVAEIRDNHFAPGVRSPSLQPWIGRRNG